jgi:hypothetical protein
VVVNVGVVKLFANVTVCASVVSLNTTLVPALTALLNVAPWLFVSVRVLSDLVWPTVPVTLTAPVLLAFKANDWVLAVLPFTAPSTCNAPPAEVNHTSSARVNAVLLSPTVSTPAPLVLMWPAALMALGAVAVKPPAKLSASVEALPKVKLPVFKNVVLPVMLVLLPNSSTL